MTQHIKSRYLMLACAFIATLLSANAKADDNIFCDVSPCIIPRSQGRDIARRSVGLMEHIHLTDKDCFWGVFSVVGEYTRTFRPGRIVECLFGADVIATTTPNNSVGCDSTSCNTRCIRIQGTEVVNREPRAWLADYFYLPSDFDSTVCFDPKIQNVIVDFDYYMGLDPFACNMYFRLYGPLTWTKWDLGFCEIVNNEGKNDHPAGYFAPVAVEREDLLSSFESYASGNHPPMIGNVSFYDLKFAQMSRCSETRFGFADLRAELGWNPWYNDCHTTGFGFIVAAPTGNNKKSCLLFEPIVGNGHHWEFGGEFHCYHRLWQWEECDWNLNFFLEANITHLFGTYQQRTFDLCNKPNSRYMLAEKLGTPIIDNLQGTNQTANQIFVPADAQFKSILQPVANLTTLNVKVSAAVEAEILAMFNFTTCYWNFDLGYNFWVRSCEKFECPESCKQKNCNLCVTGQEFMWGLKGDARVFGFVDSGVTNPIPGNTPEALSATQCMATIHQGTNVTPNARLLNTGVDYPQCAYVTGPTPLVHSPEITGPSNIIKTSIQPKFLRCPQDINFQRTRSLSHKIFGNVSYNWWDCECWVPYLGIGGFAEFGKNNKCTTSVLTDDVNKCTPFSGGSCDKDCNPCANRCIDCAVSQWGVWVKGGLAF